MVTRSARISVMTVVAALLLMALLLQYMHADGNNRYGMIRIAGEFVAGCSLCHLFQADMGRNWNWNVIVPISLAALYLLVGLVLPLGSLVPYWCIPFLALMVLGLAYRRCVWSRLISTRLFLFGGYISYSLYMVHTLCFMVLEKISPRLEARPMSFATDLVLAVITATAMYYLVEEPCRKKMRAFMASPAPASKSPNVAGP